MPSSTRSSSRTDIENGPNGESDLKPSRIPFAQRLTHFTWPWFACSMSTGSIAVVLSQQPNAFRGLDTIGKIFFILTLALFLSFSAAITYRFVCTPKHLSKSLHRPAEALFFGAFWVTIALLLTCIQQYAVPACGPWLIKTMEVLFWLYGACALMVAVFQYSTLFVAEHIGISEVVPAWIFPAYPFLVMGPLASVLIPSQPPQSALNIFTGAIMFQGLGWCISVFMYSIYMFRLMSSNLPNPPMRPGMFVSVGPAGYTSAALVGLGTQAQGVLPPNALGLGNFDVGACLKVIGVTSGMFLWLLAFWFFSLTMVAVINGARRMRFTLNSWAFIFPNAGMTLAAIQIGNALNSKGIKAVTSAMTIVLVLAWFIVAVCHIIALAKKNILWEGKDEDVETDK